MKMNFKTPTFQKKATMGFEPMMRVLQTLALPLGHVAMDNKDYKIREILCQSN
jgi:hypothetical protein